jgi:hypothetical protein
MRLFQTTTLVLLWAVRAYAVDFHVAPSGSSANPGTSEAPFATILQARDAIRALKSSGSFAAGATVILHTGEYWIDESISLTGADSGTEAAPIVYRAASGEDARLIGGRLVAMDAFGKVDDAAILGRIDEQARGNVLHADLRALGLTDFGTYPDGFEQAPTVPELFFDNKRMTVARWPNEGWAEVAKVIESGPAPWRNYESSIPIGTIEYGGDRPSRWTRAPEIWLHGYWCFDWSAESIKIGKIDVEKKQITFAKQHHYGIGSGNPAPRRFYAFNLLEELDSPGEYYIDRANGALYFWPPEGPAAARSVVTTLATPVIHVEGASHLQFMGFTIETCKGAAMLVKDCENVRISACRIRNTGQEGILVRDGHGCAIEACDIFATGNLGVHVNGGDRATLTPSKHQVVNNHIHDVSQRQRTHAYNVHMGGVGVRLAHNLIDNAPHQAIGLAGNDHIIEFNELHHIALEVDDSGAFYMGRDPSERGNIIRYNFWHDIGSKLAHGTCAVYFDDGTGGQRVFGNVFYKAAGGVFGAVFLHGGHDNWVDNNIFIECKKAIGHSPWDDAYWNKWLTEPLWQGKLLKDVDVTKAPYTDRYPELKDYMSTEPKVRVNHASNNVVVKCADLASGNWEMKGTLMLNIDPGFQDMTGGNFALKSNSMVYTQLPGFKPIPFQAIGLIDDELRAVLPK